jgi:predicted TIM-barrel fold metal-dependent hydrolase
MNTATARPPTLADFGDLFDTDPALWADQHYGRCELAGLPARDIRLLTAVADLLYSAGEFYRQTAAAADDRLDRLFGFPLPKLPKTEQDAGIRVETRVRYLQAMPAEIHAAHRRGAERIRQQYEPLQEACARVWMPICIALNRPEEDSSGSSNVA